MTCGRPACEEHPIDLRTLSRNDRNQGAYERMLENKRFFGSALQEVLFWDPIPDDECFLRICILCFVQCMLLLCFFEGGMFEAPCVRSTCICTECSYIRKFKRTTFKTISYINAMFLILIAIEHLAEACLGMREGRESSYFHKHASDMVVYMLVLGLPVVSCSLAFVCSQTHQIDTRVPLDDDGNLTMVGKRKKKKRDKESVKEQTRNKDHTDQRIKDLIGKEPKKKQRVKESAKEQTRDRDHKDQRITDLRGYGRVYAGARPALKTPTNYIANGKKSKKSTFTVKQEEVF